MSTLLIILGIVVALALILALYAIIVTITLLYHTPEPDDIDPDEPIPYIITDSETH